MTNVYLKEQRAKVEMINKIVQSSDKYQDKSELESKVLSELKYIFYDVMSPVFKIHKIAS